jgi:hypothetical protein
MCGIAFSTLVAAALVAVEPAAKSSTAELLEKGIYTEETVGDLDQAIRIYQQVLEESQKVRGLAAQAQFRVGQCLSKQGKKAEARAAFERLIADFPEAKPLVAKARQFVPAGLPLGPVPWVDGETLQLRMRMVTKLELGTAIYFAQSAERNGQKVWCVGSHTLVVLSKMRGVSRVDADWNTFRPIHSRFKNSLLGNIDAEYSPTQVVVTSVGAEGKSTKKFDLTAVVYDNEQTLHAMRRLPLAVGYKTTLPVFATMGAGKIDIPLTVQGKETIEVPAGKFECFRVHLGLVNQTFFIATDPHRYLVKFEANAVDAQLTAIGQIKPGEPRRFADDKLGLSLSVPSDWFFYNPSPGKVYVLDPQEVADTVLTTFPMADLDPKHRASLRAWAEARGAEIGKPLKDFTVRPDSWLPRKIGGLAGLSFVADYVDGKRKMVAYTTCVQGTSTAVVFSSMLPEDQFLAMRKPLDTVLDSLQVKSP